MGRYVPKTYKNRRVLRFILGAIIFIALAAVILFLLLFFVLENYFVDGKLDIPWLVDEASSPIELYQPAEIYQGLVSAFGVEFSAVYY